MLHNQQLPQQHQQPTTVQPTQTPLLHSDPQQSRQKAQNRKQNLVFHSYDTTKGKKRGVIDVEREVEEVRREPLSSDLSEEGYALQKSARRALCTMAQQLPMH